MRFPHRFFAALGLCAALLPRYALACPVCFSAKGNTLTAYYGTTVLLSLLPFVLIGSIGLWLYRQTTTRASARSHQSSDGPIEGE